jgi:hypothetical protein
MLSELSSRMIADLSGSLVGIKRHDYLPSKRLNALIPRKREDVSRTEVR